MKQIIVLPQRLARQLDLATDHAIISIRDPHDDFKFPMRWGQCGVLPLYFTDLEKPSCQEDIAALKMMTPDHARQAWDFIEQHRDVDTLVIHCWAGISRSAGMAQAVGECLSIPVNYGPEVRPNLHVFKLMIEDFEEYETHPPVPREWIRGHGIIYDDDWGFLDVLKAWERQQGERHRRINQLYPGLLSAMGYKGYPLQPIPEDPETGNVSTTPSPEPHS